MRISDWSSDVCSSDLSDCKVMAITDDGKTHEWKGRMTENKDGIEILPAARPYDAIKDGKMLKVNLVIGPKDKTFPFIFNVAGLDLKGRSEEHTSELKSLMHISYAVFCLNNKQTTNTIQNHKY